MKTTYEQLTAGTKIYYTGDIANQSEFGEVTRQYTDKWGQWVDIVLDDGRECLGISPSNFNGIGSRFQLRSEYDRERQEKIAAMNSRFAEMGLV